MQRVSRARLATAAVVLVLTLAAAVFTPDSRAAALELAAAGLVWGFVCLHPSSTRCPSAWLWAVALVLRLVVFAGGVQFSDDIQRYAWEGEVALSGRSPYAFAPIALELEPLRARFPELAARVNHPDVPAAYPPLTQACGVTAALLSRLPGATAGSSNLLWLRLMFLAGDLAVLFNLQRGTRNGWLRPNAALLWGWCPLVCVEFAGSGHFDSLGILCLLLALLAFGTRPARAAMFTGFGIAVKFLPLVLLPWSWRCSAGWRRLGHPLAALAVAGGGFLPFLWLEGGEHGFLAGLHEYGERWESSSVVYRFVEPLVRAHLVDPAAPWEEARHLARVLMGLAWVVFAAWTVLRVRDPWRGCARLVGAFLVLSPTLHPWYLVWMLPFLARIESRAWIWWIALGGLYYWPLSGWRSRAEWVEPTWLWWTIVAPFAGLLIWDLARAAPQPEREDH